MGRIVNSVLVLLMIVGALVTYEMKHEAEKAAGRVAKLQAAIAKEKEAVILLRAEWSMLTQPGRLQELVQKYAEHFRLEPFSVSQMATIGEIPLKVINPEPATEAKTLADLATDAARQ